MQRSFQRRLGALAVTALLALTAACGGDEPATDSPASDTHNEADVSFATDMISHHAQAVEMADMAIDKAESSEVVDLANQIKDAQQPEIDTMSGWLEAWDEPVPDTSMDSMSGMDHGDMAGMMTEEDMKRLDEASGARFEQLWLEMMIEHHSGAVDMAETELEEGENAEAKALAQTIIEAQEKEIATMEALVSGSSK